MYKNKLCFCTRAWIVILNGYTIDVIIILISQLFIMKYCQEQEVNGDVTRGLLDNIQREIQRKDEQMAWLDSCCLQLAIRGKEESFTFQMNSQEARKEWITGNL